MTLRTCNNIDHAPVSFTAQKCPVCAVIAQFNEEREDMQRKHEEVVGNLKAEVAARMEVTEPVF